MTFLETHAGELILLVVGIAASLVIVFVVAWPAFSKNFTVWTNLWGNLGGNPMQNTDFDNAMKCAYYRCVKGCDSNEVKSLTATWPDPQNGNTINCADFCTAGQTICGENSKNNPVRIDIGEKAYLAQDKLNPIFGTDCIISTDYQNLLLFQGINWMDVIQDSVVLEYSVIYSFFSTFSNPVNAKFVSITSLSSIDSGQAQYQITDCYIAGQKIGKNAYSSVNILSGKYQISMNHEDVVNHIWDTIYIAPYQKPSASTISTSTPATSCAAQGGNCKTLCSNDEQDLGILGCPQGGSQGAGETCCK